VSFMVFDGFKKRKTTHQLLPLKPYEIIYRMPNPCFEGTRKNDPISLFSVIQNAFL